MTDDSACSPLSTKCDPSSYCTNGRLCFLFVVQYSTNLFCMTVLLNDLVPMFCCTFDYANCCDLILRIYCSIKFVPLQMYLTSLETSSLLKLNSYWIYRCRNVINVFGKLIIMIKGCGIHVSLHVHVPILHPEFRTQSTTFLLKLPVGYCRWNMTLVMIACSFASLLT